MSLSNMNSSGHPDGADLVRMANDMLSQLHVSHRVQRWTDINADVFVTLFEGLCGETLQDIVRNPKTWEDQVQNVQTVIDTLSLDVLNTSLSHITGEGIVGGSMADIHNLMEVFSGLLEYILERIGSDTSTDNEDRLDDFEDDPDLVTPEVIDSILERELGRSHRENSMRSQRSYISKEGDTTKDLIALGQQSHLDLSSRPSANNTSELIALGGSSFERSPHRRRASPDGRSKPNGSRTAHNGTYHEESTAELIREGEQLEQAYGPLPRSPGSLSSHSYGNERSPTRVGAAAVTRPPNAYPRSLSPTSLSTGSYLDLPPEVIHASRTAGPLDNLRRTAFGAPPPQVERGTSMTIPLEAARGTNLGIPVSQGVPSSSVPSEFDLVGVRPRPQMAASTASDDVLSTSTVASQSASSQTSDHSMTSDMFSSSLPVAGHAVAHNLRPGYTYPSSRSSLHESLRSHSTVNGMHAPSETSSRSSRIESMVENTAAMARRAVNNSPLRGGSSGRLTPDIDEELSEALKNTLRNVHKKTREINHLATSAPSSPERPQSSTSKGRKSPSPRKVNGKVPTRKVCFKTGRSSDDQTSSDSRSPPRNKKAPGPAKKKGPPMSLSQRPVQDNTQPAPAPKPATAPAKLQNIKTKVGPRQVADELAPRRQLDTRGLVLDNEDPIPKTFQQYLDKYYGTIERRDDLAEESRDESMRHSDTELDYSHAESRERTDTESRDADLSRNATSSPDRESRINDTLDISADVDLRQMQEDLAWLRSQIRARKSVRFEDVLDDAAPGHMDGLRYKLTQEERKARGKADMIGRMYEYELEDFKEQFHDNIKDTRKKAKETEKEFKKKAIRAPKTNKSYKPTKKYGVSVGAAGRGAGSRSRSRTQTTRGRKRSVSASPSVGRKRDPEPDLLPWLLEEFPFLHLSTQTLHELWRRSAKQMEQLSKAEKEVQRKKSKAQVQIEEAERRQKILLDIMKKELAHNHRMKDLKERQQQQQLVKSRIRDKRVSSARSRRYYDEFQVRMRSKMLRKRTREEAIFRSLFKDGLNIQKDRIRELRRYAKEQREMRNKRQQDELENLENYYRDQFSMLAESMQGERNDLDIREKAQAKVLDQMKKELRKKMESEIRQFQEQLYRDEDEEYFRQLDADRLRNTLQMARFQANV